MASLASDTLARLRVCRAAGMPIPADLQDDAIECIAGITDATAMRERRDALIRRAALLMPSAPPHQKAAQLADEAKVMQRTWHVLRARHPSDALDTPRACLHAAALRARLPESQRQFYRVLISPMD